jgi:hypothetical protein
MAPEMEKSPPQAAADRPGTHYVTPRQLADANAMLDRNSGEVLQGIGPDSRALGWDELSGGRPVVLVFLKDGCPCSATFAPFIQRVERLYRGTVHFAGVMDAPVETTRRYATEWQLPYPILADPDRRLIRRFQAKNGGYVVLLTPAGVMDGCWPGWSGHVMQELGRRIARLAGVEERPLDVAGMPAALTAGCPFDS